MKKLQKILILLMVAAVMVSMCACGSSQSAYTSGSTINSSYYAAEDYAADYDEDFGFAAAGASFVKSAEMESVEEYELDEEEQELQPSKIIYSSDVTVETTTFDETVGQVDGLVQKYGAWVESSSVNGANYYQQSHGYSSTRSANYTLRVPSAKFSEIMSSFSELGNIPYSHVYTENVTSQYYDTEAHLKAYQTQENRLLEMMEKAETVEDIITIEDRLTELRYRIESLQSSLNNWDRRVSYSSIYLTIQEVEEYTPEEVFNPNFWQKISIAFKNGIRAARQFLEDLVVFIVGALPVIVVLIPLVILVIWLVRKIAKRAKIKRENGKPEKEKEAEEENSHE